MNEATVPAWFSFLAEWEIVVIAAAVKLAVAGSPSFVPTAPLVAEHCKSVAKTSIGKPQDLSLPCLPEAEAQLDPHDPRYADFQAINAKIRSGELRGVDIARAFASLVAS